MKVRPVIVSCLLLTYPVAIARGQSCASLMGTPSASIAFLQQQVSTRQSPCITAVIKHLGKQRDEKAISVLVSYLDFINPSTLGSPDTGSGVRPSYPAVEALFRIGEPAARELIRAIEDSQSLKVRDNAEKTYLFIYREDYAAGIRQLKKEESTSKSEDSLNRLSETRKMLFDVCSNSTRQQSQACEDADADND